MYRLTRFVTRDGNARAIVYIAFTENHGERLVKFAVSIGDWQDEDLEANAAELRRCFNVWYKDLPDHYGFMMRDPADGDWQERYLLGRQLTREEALRDDLVAEVWEILDRVVVEDPVLHPYLCNGNR
ncbi:MAG: hypothetical protein QM757_44070 [Paludibaculum sp.]